MTSLIVTMLGTSSSLIVCAVAGGLSTVGTAVLEVLSLHDRWINHHHSHVQLLNVYNDISAHILHEGVTSTMLDNIINDLNHRSMLLYDTAPLINNQPMISSIVNPRWSRNAPSVHSGTPTPPHMAVLDVCVTDVLDSKDNNNIKCEMATLIA